MLSQILSRGLSIFELSESLIYKTLSTRPRHGVAFTPANRSVKTFVSLTKLDLAKSIALCLIQSLDLADLVLANRETSGVASHTTSFVRHLQILNRIITRELC